MEWLGEGFRKCSINVLAFREGRVVWDMAVLSKSEVILQFSIMQLAVYFLPWAGAEPLKN